jgi:hypothetical protein
MTNQNTFKAEDFNNNSNPWIVSMNPGDREVAGCLFSDNAEGIL